MIDPSRLRIAFIADTLRGDVGGAIIAGRRLVEALRTEHEVSVVGIGAERTDDTNLRGFVLPLRAMREMYFVMARPDRAAVARAIADVDVVHLQFPFWLSFVALAEARKAGKPVVAAFHVQPENAFLNIGVRWPWLNSRVYRYWVDRFYNRVDAVICPSAFAQKKLVEHGLTTPSFVISNGVPPDVAEVAPLVRVSPSDEVTIVMVGRLAAEKRQDLLIEAVKRSRHRDRIRLVLMGAGPRNKRLVKLARGLPRPVEIGFQPRQRLIELLGTADLFVHCSEVELEGIAVLEALHMGLPALIADAPESAASAFALDDDFKFPAGDVDALTAKLDWLLDHPAMLAAARDRARRMARGFAHDSSFHEVVDVYRSVVPATQIAHPGVMLGRPVLSVEADRAHR